MKIKRKSRIGLFSLIVATVIGGVLVGQNYRNQTVEAASPAPDACFFREIVNGQLKAIYYQDYENGNPSQPECPADLVIPDNIGVELNGSLSAGFISFKRSKDLNIVKVPETIHTLLPDSFSVKTTNKPLINEVQLPASLRSVGYGAFSIDSNDLFSAPVNIGVKKVVFNDNSITNLGVASFTQSPVEEIVLPASLKTIEIRAFYHAYNLKTLTIPASVEKVDVNAFNNASIEHLIIEGRDTIFSDFPGAAYAEYYSNSIKEITLAYKMNTSSIDESYASLCKLYGVASSEKNGIWFDPSLQNSALIMKVNIQNENDYPINSRYCQLSFNGGRDDSGEDALYGASDRSSAFAAIVGPTSVTYRYVDEQGNELAPSETFASRDNANVAYSMKALRDHIGRDQMTLDDLTYVSYFTGYNMTVNAKEIAGYTALEQSQDRELRLDASKNIFTFVYKKNVETANEVPLVDSATQTNVKTPNTGLKNKTIPFAGLGVIGVAAFGVIYYILRKR